MLNYNNFEIKYIKIKYIVKGKKNYETNKFL